MKPWVEKVRETEMETWPNLRLANADQLQPGSLIQLDGHLGMVVHDLRGKLPLLVMINNGRFVIGPTRLGELSVMHYAGELVVDFLANQFTAGFPNGAPGPDTGTALLIGKNGPIAVVATDSLPRNYSLLELETGNLAGRDNGGMPAVSLWRLGVRANKDSIVWLAESQIEVRLDIDRGA